MLDIAFIREYPDQVRSGARSKGVEIDINRLLELDTERRRLIKESEELRSRQNKASEEIAGESDAAAREERIAAVRGVKESFKRSEIELEKVASELEDLMRQIPNLPLPDVRIGKSDEENYEIRQVGQIPDFGFPPKDYITLGEELDLIDTKRASKVAGARFGYLKGDAVLLEFALVQYALSVLVPEGFVPLIPPVLINERSMRGMGYLERGEDEIFRTERDGYYLVGTSEQAIGPMHADEVFREAELPKRYVGFSSCFRREAGSYGKDVRGILRVHQFDKLEMFSFTLPEDSDKEHEDLLTLQEKLMQGLGLPYRVVGIVSGDLGDPAARKYDIEAWIPSQGTYRETHSTSTTTDWQSRRLNVRVRRDSGERQYAHMLNGTAFAIGRTIIAILENHQKQDGSIEIPQVLVPYMQGKTDLGR
ncbi:hypothetical protein AMJ57_03240 [Parcubacteria bacterium SG8_24]|nr:MAG: hypothetical protein AMJ57_03240 [Parcubacteria bacterium SG8_24]